jgi:hypothetical protein
VISELRELYAKALNEPALVEAVSDGQAGEAGAENLPQVAGPLVEVAAGAEPARAEAEDEAPEPGEPASVETFLVAEHLNPPVQFRRERVPGYFPAKYRRVPIEP